MDRIIDLDSARAARAEANKDVPVIKFNNKNYNLPIELPFSIVEAASTQNPTEIINAIKKLFGSEWVELEKDFSMADMTFLLENIVKIYAVEPGK